MAGYHNDSNAEYEEPRLLPVSSGIQREEFQIKRIKRRRELSYFFFYSLLLLLLIVISILLGGFYILSKSLKDIVKDTSDLKKNNEIVQKKLLNITNMNISCKKTAPYHVFTNSQTWATAFRICKRAGLELVSIPTSTDQNNLENFMLLNGYNETYWTSGIHLGNENYYWATTVMPEYQNTCDEEYQEAPLSRAHSGTQMEELQIEPVKRSRKSKYFYLYFLILLSLIVNVLLLGGFSFLLTSLKDTVKDVSDLQGKMEVVHKNFTRTLNFICKEPGSMCTPKFYILSTDTASFTEATTKCQSKNMTFVSLKSDEEFEALNGHFKSTTVTGNWFRLSGTRINAGSIFYWTPSGQLVTNQKWWPTYPINSEQQNCIFVQLFTDNNNIKLHTGDCNSAQKYVCEYKK